VVTLALTVLRPLAAADGARGGACSNRSLRGDYGILISGIAPAGPTGQTETTAGTALRTYDGHGNFSQVDNVHGQISGAVLDRPGFGTYEVRADCSGTATLFLTGFPFPIVSSFVIVDGGETVAMGPDDDSVHGAVERVKPGGSPGGLGYDPDTDTLWVGDLQMVRKMTLAGAVLSSFTGPIAGRFIDGLEFINTGR
jgi:hypothetical protein